MKKSAQFVFRFVLTLIVLSSFLLTPHPVQAAQTFTVDTLIDAHDDDLTDNICQTATGVCSLRAAVEQANAIPAGIDTIIVPSGTFQFSHGTIAVTDLMIIDGNGPALTILNGLNTANLFEVNVGYTGDNTYVTFKDMKITNSQTAIHVIGGMVNIENVTFEDNHKTSGDGGALNLEGLGPAKIYYSKFISNSATNGGAIAVNKTMNITGDITNRVEFTLNSSTADGGAIYHTGGSVKMESVRFYNNNAGGNGGAMKIGYTGAGGNFIKDGVIIENTAGIAGGGIHTADTVDIFQSSISRNSAVDGGGIYAADWFDIENTTIGENTATNNGGGIYANNMQLELSNVTITGNIADYDDSGDGDGGGIWWSGTSNYIRLRNSILAKNKDNSTGIHIYAPDCIGTIESKGYLLVGKKDGVCTVIGDATGLLYGTFASPLDPQLGAYDTFIGSPYFPVLHGSPAVDAGDPAGCKDAAGVLISSDQHGENRIRGNYCDLGASESPYIADFHSYLPFLKN
jgi:predicted outer membrane repeat protein